MSITTALTPCRIGEKEYQLRPLTIKQIDELDHWMQIKFLRSVREAAEGDEDMLRFGMHEMVRYSFFTKAGARFLSSIPGVSKMISISANLSYEEARELVTRDVDLAEFESVFASINGLSKKEESPLAEAEKAEA